MDMELQMKVLATLSLGWLAKDLLIPGCGMVVLYRIGDMLLLIHKRILYNK